MYINFTILFSELTVNYADADYNHLYRIGECPKIADQRPRTDELKCQSYGLWRATSCFMSC